MSTTILFTYRDKEISRVKNCLDSLYTQSDPNFNIIFVDYGSQQSYSLELQNLLSNFQSVLYHYTYTFSQSWSRAKAINIGLQLVKSEYVFVADIDMIFRNDFVEKLKSLQHPNKSTFFKVGFIPKTFTDYNQAFEKIPISFSSNVGAQGLSLFNVDALKKINGFDEFYHFWGAEDEDVHHRLKVNNNSVEFYDKEILMLHQWHPTYRNSETKFLTQELQLSGVVKLNAEHLQNTISNKFYVANQNGWGYTINKEQKESLKNPEKKVILRYSKHEVDHFIAFTLKQPNSTPTEYIFEEKNEKMSLKQYLKKMIKKPDSSKYSLKEINDLLLLHIISSPNIKNYNFTVSQDLKSISLIF